MPVFSQVKNFISRRFTFTSNYKFQLFVPENMSPYVSIKESTIDIPSSVKYFKLTKDTDLFRPVKIDEKSPITLPPETLIVHWNDVLPFKFNSLPPTLQSLKINSSSFDEPIGCLPLSLTHLHIGSRFNQPVDCLPPNLEHLS